MQLGKVLRNTAVIIAGILLGGAINMGIVLIGPYIVPPPPGVDVASSESIAESLHLFETKHFIFPFLAHALGTFAGALFVYLLAASSRARLPYIVAGVFFAGGVLATVSIPAPYWFIVLDLVLAYFPMTWAAVKLGQRFGREV